MNRTKVEKTFDCLAFKDRVQAEIYEEIKDLTPPQQIEYYYRRAERGPASAWWQKARRASARGKP